LRGFASGIDRFVQFTIGGVRETMKRMAVVVLLLVALSSCIPDTKNTSYDIRFGIVEHAGDGFVLTKETDRIPLVPRDEGHISGLEITPSGTRAYTVDVVVFSPDSSTEGIELPSLTHKGKSVSPMWFDPGDPLGTYKLEIKIDGVATKTIEFEAVEPGSTDTEK
jgi:hypothetical protein